MKSQDSSQCDLRFHLYFSFSHFAKTVQAACLLSAQVQVASLHLTDILMFPFSSQIRKAFHKSESKKEFSVVTNLSTMAVCATTPVLPTAVASQDLKPHQVVVPQVQVSHKLSVLQDEETLQHIFVL